MSKFFINRPIVAMVIAIVMVICGVVALVSLPVAQFPEIVPPEVQIIATYTGADAITVEQSVATPIEQQMSGVDNMNYMYSINASNGTLRETVNFDVKTNPNVDLILTQMRQTQANSQLPADVVNLGLTVQKSRTSPMMLIALYSPNGTYDGNFLANYAYINLIDQLVRIPGIAQVNVFGAGQYAMRLWVKPDQLAKLDLTVSDIVQALQAQNAVNPAGQIGAEPAPPGQEFTYTVLAQGRLLTAEEFGEIVLRANPDGSMVRVKDVARIELGVQTYNLKGRLNGKPAAVMALYQLPGSNALEAADGVKAKLAELKPHFPPDLEYAVSLDTTLAVSAGMREIFTTLWQALLLVHPGGLHLPAGLARDADPDAGRAGVAHRRVHPLPGLRVLRQHPLAVRADPGDRAGGGRRDRGGGVRGAPHRGRPVAARGGAEGDGGSLRPGDRHRDHPRGGVHPDGVHPRDHRAGCISSSR